MKSIIFYYSKTGNCKKYAESLSNRLDCDFFDYKKMKYSLIKDKELVMFIGPVFNNKIGKVEKFLKLYPKIKDKHLFLVAVGMQPSNAERRESIIIVNLLKDYHIRLYELLGSFDINKLSFIKRKIMMMAIKMQIKNDPNLKMYENRIMDLYNHPMNVNDVEGIDRIMNTVHRLEREVNI